MVEHLGVYVKYEINNLTGSIKDRAALSFLNSLKEQDKYKTIICATSGNLGISLARLCKMKNLKLTIIMPKTNDGKKRIIENEGANIIETNEIDGMKGALKELNKYKLNQNYIYFNQFNNLYNPLGYFDLCREIVKEFKDLDYVIVGIGSGGTFLTLNKVLKKCYPNIKVIGVLPFEKELIEGIGANVLNHVSKLKKDVRYVKRSDALSMTKSINNDGIPLGISSGACFKVALDIKKNEPSKKILIIAHDGIDRYSDIFV